MNYQIELFKDDDSIDNICKVFDKNNIKYEIMSKYNIDKGIIRELYITNGGIIHHLLKNVSFKLSYPQIMCIADNNIKMYKKDIHDLFLKNEVYSKMPNLFFYDENNEKELIKWFDINNIKYDCTEIYDHDKGYQDCYEINVEGFRIDIHYSCWLLKKNNTVYTSLFHIYNALIENNITQLD